MRTKAPRLQARIRASLRRQGYGLSRGRIVTPGELDKSGLRDLHRVAVGHQRELAGKYLQRHESDLLDCFSAGADVVPDRISPRLIQVQSDSREALVFRYAKLHWSVPVSAGYGRRVRFLVVDEQNGKLIGVLGLCDPVYNLGARDQWIGWSSVERRARLKNVMDAYVLGAVPPYSMLLCGKLVAMLAGSDEVREAFRSSYSGKSSRIRRKPLDARLALVTTSSALGRSSIYNRIRHEGRSMYLPLGFTRGSGEFHFANGDYRHIFQYAMRYCAATERKSRWGLGFRNRREVVRKALSKLGLSKDCLFHGIEREVYAVPLARNSREFLRGEHSKLLWHEYPAADLFAAFRERWLLPRAERDQRYRDWQPEQWRLWPK